MRDCVSGYHRSVCQHPTGSLRVAGCSRQLVRPWSPGGAAPSPTGCRETAGRLRWAISAGNFFSFPIADGELRRIAGGQSSTADSTRCSRAGELLALALEDTRAFFFLPTATALLSSQRSGERSGFQSMSPYIFPLVWKIFCYQ